MFQQLLLVARLSFVPCCMPTILAYALQKPYGRRLTFHRPAYVNQALAENISKNPAAAELAFIDRFLVLADCVPEKVSDVTMGAVGVGGAPAASLMKHVLSLRSKTQDQLKQSIIFKTKSPRNQSLDARRSLHHFK